MNCVNTKPAGTGISESGIENRYLNFRLGDTVYGISIRHVLQIIGMRQITEMPEMPRYMKGFIHLRGNVIPLISMRLRFGQDEEEAYTDRTCIIVIQIGQKEIGLIVDAILETMSIETENISPPPYMGENADTPYIMGITKLSNGCASILINVQKLLSGQL